MNRFVVPHTITWLALCAREGTAELRLAALFQDHAVLRRDKAIEV